MALMGSRNPRKQLTRSLISLLSKHSSTNVRIDNMTNQQVKERIAAIRMWDSLQEFECPMCETKGIKLDSQSDRGFNLKCTHCDAHYEMSLSRSLGARLIVK